GACLLLSLVAVADGHAQERDVRAEQERQKILDIARNEWKVDGAERRKLRESLTTIEKNLTRATASMARTLNVAETTAMSLPHSGVPEKLARLEETEKERARWLREQAVRDRERQQKEREAAERERGVR
ncbi:MAG TPA: hypothetical protein VF948_00855, partial [Methylomirabilota bacterium]